MCLEEEYSNVLPCLYLTGESLIDNLREVRMLCIHVQTFELPCFGPLWKSGIWMTTINGWHGWYSLAACCTVLSLRCGKVCGNLLYVWYEMLTFVNDRKKVVLAQAETTRPVSSSYYNLAYLNKVSPCTCSSLDLLLTLLLLLRNLWALMKPVVLFQGEKKGLIGKKSLSFSCFQLSTTFL